MKHLTRAELDRIAAQISDGTSAAQLARQHGVPYSTLRYRLTVTGNVTRHDPRLLTMRETELMALRVSGLRPRDIAKKLGLAASGVRSIISDANRKIEAAMANEPVFPIQDHERVTPADHKWTPEKIAELQALVAGGLSESAAGRAMGIGKNAAIGKLRRLNGR